MTGNDGLVCWLVWNRISKARVSKRCMEDKSILNCKKSEYKISIYADEIQEVKSIFDERWMYMELLFLENTL